MSGCLAGCLPVRLSVLFVRLSINFACCWPLARFAWRLFVCHVVGLLVGRFVYLPVWLSLCFLCLLACRFVCASARLSSASSSVNSSVSLFVYQSVRLSLC